MSNFVHLHNHSHYSILDGMSTPEEICTIAAGYGQKAVAITDHGTCGSFIKFQEAAKETGIKPIFGCEMYFVPFAEQDREDKRAERSHLILLAKNEEGLQNLYKLQRASWVDAFYFKPRVDFSMLSGLGRGIIATSSCMGGVVARALREGKEFLAVMYLEQMRKTFDDFYVELQPWNELELNTKLIEIATSMDIPMVGTIDCHYPTLQHREVEEVLLCVNTYPSLKPSQVDFVKNNYKDAKKLPTLEKKLDFLYPDRRMRFVDHGLYLMSEAEVVAAFKEAGVDRQDIIDNTVEVAEKCNAKIVFGMDLLPKFDRLHDSNDYLRELAEFRLEELSLDKGTWHADGETYKARLEEELSVIINLNFANYFLVVWDLVNWAKKNDIYVGAGRGSAAGSLLAYVLGITDVDPIEHGLIFWRFINPDRLDYPDIDLDFEDRRRPEVKQYLRDRWGHDKVASIATYGAFKAKAVVKDISRVLGVPISEANEATKHFETMDEYRSSPQLSEFRANWPDIQRAADALYLRIKETGAHAAGMVVSKVPLEDIAPVETRKDTDGETGDRIETVAYDMNDCQKLGLIKMDILGLNTLSVAHDAINFIKERHGKDVLLDSQTLDDKKVFAEFSSARTSGIFQTESSAYKNLLLKMGIDNFNDLAASNALVRPGALATQTDTYINRKRGREAVSYLHPILEGITGETYGTFVYQEQIMETAVKLAGFNWREADTLRKIMGKKKDEREWEEFREKFVSGASKHIAPSKAKKMWEDFVLFSGYAFNKSHAISYSKLSYQTMWLKIYYPLEFMCALLRNEKDKQYISTYLLEAKRMGITLLPPDINRSEEKFSLDGDGIRFGLGNIAGVGSAAVKDILSKRPFSSFDEFYNKRATYAVKSISIEALNKVGAFESLGFHSEYEHKRYYFELLSYPIDLNLATELDERISPCSEVDESGKLSVIKAIVRSTKRTQSYFRVEFEDTSGSLTVFAPKDFKIKDGDFLIALVGDKTIHSYIDVYAIDESQDHPLYQFLKEDFIDQAKECYGYDVLTITEAKEKLRGDIEIPFLKVLGHVVSAKPFRTKKGDLMCYGYVWDGQDFHKLTLFPRQYGQNAFKFKEGSTLVIKLEFSPGKRGYSDSFVIPDNGIIGFQDYLNLKRSTNKT